MDISEKIQSIRSTIGVTYEKPDPKQQERYVSALATSDKAKEYLAKRKINNPTIEHFKLGYCEALDAITIPIFKNGELINIKYRKLDENAKPKYLNTTGAEGWLFNDVALSRAKEKGRLLIVEGEFDAMTAWQAGFESVISPASGKDSYGVWIEMLREIPMVYIAYDSDKPGQDSASKLADRLGFERCFQVNFPEGIKDTNEFFLTKEKTEYLELIKNAVPFTRNKFKNVGDIIKTLRAGSGEILQTQYMPSVKLRDGFQVVISGKTNVGKTAYVLNIADDFARREIPTLIMPFERGIDMVGERYLHIHFGKSPEDIGLMTENDWEEAIRGVADLPLYFALPKREEISEVIRQARRAFGIKIVIIDHLDYLIRNVRGNKEQDISNTLQEYKRIGEELGVIFLIVSHIRKVDGQGFTAVKTRPGMEDLKGSSSLYQDPEVVIMLSQTENNEEVLVDVVKNKGPEGSSTFRLVPETGQYKTSYQIVKRDFEKPKTPLEDLWNNTP